ncbi:nuclear transport factor 2 family protein [Hymenobacter sediminicola]|uniref:Nuclear transport factor 2 family protein n=1 Tax=Hymenobacter sediminicola TaxID=2761579 RepID=A0A7G7W4F5_9BACT|nr:nuclear transport factor 2 family protein [Hymenobacter sediminicola]QNH61248.1 nuclear transport factor 2 family protein [Hymenobacter sediminicola]
MKNWYVLLSGVAMLGACATVKTTMPAAAGEYKPVDTQLYRTIAQQDSLMFVAFNQHDVAKLQSFFAEDLEFYHDKGGLANFQQTMQGFRSLFDQNKTTGLHRQLVPGTLEVYPINNYGAVETYQHRFCHVENGRDDCGTFKNMMVWRLRDGRWQVTRVVSYGH